MDLIVFLATAVLFTFSTVSSQDACASPPSGCSCVAGYMECVNLPNITSRIFAKPTILKSLRILNSTNLTIANRSFEGLSLTRLELSNNGLTSNSLQSDTFKNLNVSDVSLSHNYFQKIPECITVIPNLKGLDMSYNPIQSFSDPEFDSTETMKKLGSSLVRFSFGSRDIGVWPTELAYFPKLEELNVTGGRFSLMSLDAFYGYDKSLKKLTIENTLLNSVPLAIGGLDFLTELRFDHNTRVGDYGMNSPIVKGHLTHLGLLSLKDDNITTFPAIIGTFASLTQLIMDENNLKFVSDVSAKAVKQVTYLSLRNAGIARIPGALQDIVTLKTLDLSDNSIHSIEREDLQHLTKLEELMMNNNPVLYISKDAFKDSRKLINIQLNNTRILKVPCAFEQLKAGAVNIYLGNNKIDCTCELTWIRNMKNIKVHGRCETIDSLIQDYIQNQLTTCPHSDLCVDESFIQE